MPSSNLPPEEQPKVKPFDPACARPHRDRGPTAQGDAGGSRTHRESRTMPQEFNSVIEFNKNFRGGAKAAREEVLKMAEARKDKALEASTKRVESAE